MDDVKMMLGYRAAEYYLFVTWLVTAPLLTIVSCLRFWQQSNCLLSLKIITVLNLVNSETLQNKEGDGFAAYVFPQWSAILGWIIFVICIIPIPLFFLISYIQEYRRLPQDYLVR
jgi:hypothetical protein